MPLRSPAEASCLHSGCLSLRSAAWACFSSQEPCAEAHRVCRERCGAALGEVCTVFPSWPASPCLTEAALAPCLGQGLLAGALLVRTGIPSRGLQGRLLFPVALCPSHPSSGCAQLGERPPPGPFCQGPWITLTWAGSPQVRLLCMSGTLELDWGGVVSAGGRLGLLCSEWRGGGRKGAGLSWLEGTAAPVTGRAVVWCP